ncbi:MAG: zinc ribbon domain-containing protein [Tetrasphaera sp.]|nr:zinc ribbon domain-containing protein [Tetrasphaera sp.]
MSDLLCPACGAANPAGSAFCEACGHDLGGMPPAPPPRFHPRFHPRPATRRGPRAVTRRGPRHVIAGGVSPGR